MTMQDTSRVAPGERVSRDDAPVPNPARRPLLLPFIIVLAALVGGWGVWQAVDPLFASAGRGSGARAPAPPIEAQTVDGGHFSLAAQRGTVVVVYSMAAWCIACVPEAIALGQMARATRSPGVVTLLVDENPASDTPAAVRAFRTRTHAPARSWVIDRGGAIARAYGVAALETTIVIDRAGHVAGRYRMSLDVGALRRVTGRAT